MQNAKGAESRVSMIKAQNSHIDLLEQSLHTEPRYASRQVLTRHSDEQQHRPEHPEASHAENIAHLKALLIARSDGEERIARIDMLKAQIEAGSYCVDSNDLAHKLQGMPFVRSVVDRESQDILGRQADE